MEQVAFGIMVFNLIIIIQDNLQKRTREHVEKHTLNPSDFLESLIILSIFSQFYQFSHFIRIKSY